MKATFFPLGDIQYKDRIGNRRCLWRELSMILHYIIQAVNPKIPLSVVIKNWREISIDLQDPIRKRKKQIINFS